MKSLLLLLLIVFFSCKGGEKEVDKVTLVDTSWRDWVNDTTNDISVSGGGMSIDTVDPTFEITKEGTIVHPINKNIVPQELPENIPTNKYKLGGKLDYDINHTQTVYHSGSGILAVDSFGTIVFPENFYTDTLPIHWTSDSTQAYFLLEDIQMNYFSISDSNETVATRDNKTGKWDIVDCQRALEVVYKLDSICHAEYEIKYTPKNKKSK